jgi:hypothetical protein
LVRVTLQVALAVQVVEVVYRRLAVRQRLPRAITAVRAARVLANLPVVVVVVLARSAVTVGRLLAVTVATV